MKKRVTDTSIACYYEEDRTSNRLATLRLLGDGIPRSARQCSEELHMPERNNVHPRLNELEHQGLIVKLPEKVKYKDRMVTAYQITDHGARWLAALEGSPCSKTGT